MSSMVFGKHDETGKDFQGLEPLLEEVSKLLVGLRQGDRVQRHTLLILQLLNSCNSCNSFFSNSYKNFSGSWSKVCWQPAQQK